MHGFNTTIQPAQIQNLPLPTWSSSYLQRHLHQLAGSEDIGAEASVPSVPVVAGLGHQHHGGHAGLILREFEFPTEANDAWERYLPELLLGGPQARADHFFHPLCDLITEEGDINAQVLT